MKLMSTSLTYKHDKDGNATLRIDIMRKTQSNMHKAFKNTKALNLTHILWIVRVDD